MCMNMRAEEVDFIFSGCHCNAEGQSQLYWCKLSTEHQIWNVYSVTYQQMNRHETAQLFEKLVLEEEEKGISQEASLLISQTCAVLRTPATTKTVEFSYKNKFELTWAKDKLGVKTVDRLVFYCQNEVIKLRADKSDDLKACCALLSKKLNKKGFYENMKPYKKLGKGNFGTVYLVQRLDDGKEMAAKAFLKYNLMAIDNGMDLLETEVSVMRACNHPGILGVYEVYETEHSVYLCVQRLKGGSLARYIMRGRYELCSIAGLMRQLLTALAHLHSNGIMHRDLKCDNIMFRDEDDLECVIIDFGLAQRLNADTYKFPRCGTPGYVAPEVINLENFQLKYSEACDIFSLGLIFYELICKRPAFKPTPEMNMLKVNKNCDIDFSLPAKTGIGKEALSLLFLMLEKDPVKRITAKQALAHRYIKAEMLISKPPPKMRERERSSGSEQELGNTSRVSLPDKTDKEEFPKKLSIKDSIGNFMTLEKQDSKLLTKPICEVTVEEEQQSPTIRPMTVRAEKLPVLAGLVGLEKEKEKEKDKERAKAVSFSDKPITQVKKPPFNPKGSLFKPEKRSETVKLESGQQRTLMITVPEGESATFSFQCSNPGVHIVWI